MDKYIDRKDAGISLANFLKDYANHKNAIVLALPRGGVPVAYEVAMALSIPQDIFLVRKLGVPGHEELAMGAIASGGETFFNKLLLSQLNLTQQSIDAVKQSEQKELIRREHLYRGKQRFPNLLGKTVILVDDGMATGATMQVAVTAISKQNPAAIIIAVPVAAPATCDELAAFVDKIICPLKPLNFHAVGLWYENFPQVSDSEVIELLKRANITTSHN